MCVPDDNLTGLDERGLKLDSHLLVVTHSDCMVACEVLLQADASEHSGCNHPQTEYQVINSEAKQADHWRNYPIGTQLMKSPP